MWIEALRFLINTAFGLVVYTALLRFIMQWLRAPFRNPVGQTTIALTDWAVKPLRRMLPGHGGYDWASLLLAWFGQCLWLGALALVSGAALSGSLVGLLAALSIVELIKAALWIMIGAIFIQAILSWVAPDGPLSGTLNALTFPFLRPIRRRLPPIGGTLDLSPLIVIVVAQVAMMTVVPWLESALTRIFL